MKRPRSDLSCSDRKEKDTSYVVTMMLEFIKICKLGSWLQLIH